MAYKQPFRMMKWLDESEKTSHDLLKNINDLRVFEKMTQNIELVEDESKNEKFLKMHKDSEIKVRCLNNQSRNILSWGLYVLSGRYFPDELNKDNSDVSYNDSIKDSVSSVLTLNSPSHSKPASSSLRWIHTKDEFKSQIENLLKCKYVIEFDFRKERCKEQNSMAPQYKSIASVRSDITSSTIMVEEQENLEISTEVPRIGNLKSNEMIVPFFHLSIINFSYYDVILECIMDQCQKEIDENSNEVECGKKFEEQYILRNLRTAFTEKIYCGDTNSYLHGMNALHLASFCHNCELYNKMNKVLFEARKRIDKVPTYDDSDKTSNFKFHNLEGIAIILKSAMEEEIKNTKETPKNIAARHCDLRCINDFYE